MTMRIEFFCIPVYHGNGEVEQLNQLLSSARILTVGREFVADGENSFWSICVQLQTANQRSAGVGRKPSVDYREILSTDDFSVFAKLRELRKSIAVAEAIPPYSVFTNEQLAQMTQRRVSTLSAMKDIEGIGEARVTKYGQLFLSELEKVRDGVNGVT